jgi:hypothetical protein
LHTPTNDDTTPWTNGEIKIEREAEKKIEKVE